MKQNCPALIYLKVNSSGNKLEIAKMIDSHNNTTSQFLFNNLPNQKRLTSELRSKVIELMNLKENKKLIQSKIQSTTMKSITLKDLTIIYSKGML